MASIRTFVAVDISNRIRSNASRVISRLRDDATDYNWVEADNLHVSLNFLGDVPEVEVPDVCKVVTSAVQDCEGFAMSVRGLGCFPMPEKPRVVWLGVDEGRDKLAELNEKIATALEALRFPRDRIDYHPHLTLGRIRRNGHYSSAITNAVADSSNLEAGTAQVGEVIVYSSFLDKSGPSYTAMTRIPLD